ncbi:hypothetical protein NS359_07980 [Curtobacterium oceanosedimentum]|uniref:Uncharacterized protein n=1 Tax=Curtobacterium oceanosedimentum TaxID=465820 RepID=A0A147DR18_9MICO|nr:hypothetical protein NS359_07980 [Curtobacterium oceanosedimentum]
MVSMEQQLRADTIPQLGDALASLLRVRTVLEVPEWATRKHRVDAFRTPDRRFMGQDNVGTAAEDARSHLGGGRHLTTPPGTPFRL